MNRTFSYLTHSKQKQKNKGPDDDFLNDGDPYDDIGPQKASVGAEKVRYVSYRILGV